MSEVKIPKYKIREMSLKYVFHIKVQNEILPNTAQDMIMEIKIYCSLS